MDEEERRIQDEKLMASRRQKMQLSKALAKPLVFGLTEDLNYPYHKNPVCFFIENNNNK